jgi:hypothetical protein
MSGAFQYRPKFVDIRVRPPVDGEEARAEDVHALKDGEVRCDHPGCLRAATAKAPKSRDMLHEHYHFCQPHAAEYNKQWDFFAGMSEDQIRAHQEARATGERPTWSFKASNRSRAAAAAAARDGRAAVLFRQPRLAIAAGEGEGHAAGLERIGHRKDRLAAQVHVEKRQIDVGRLREIHGLVQLGGRTHHGTAEVGQHVLHQHGDEHFVLDDEDFQTGKVGAFAHQALPRAYIAANGNARTGAGFRESGA